MSTDAYNFSILGCSLKASGDNLVYDADAMLAGHGGTLAVSSGFAISNGPVFIFGDDDDATVRKYALRTQTSGNEVSEFRLDYPNGLSGVPIREEHTYVLDATIVCKTQDSQTSTECAMFKIQGLLVDDALGLELVEPYTINNIYRFSSDLGVSATGIKQNDEELLQINVTGVAGKNINWVAGLNLVELGGASTNPYGKGRQSFETYRNYDVGNYCIMTVQPDHYVVTSSTDQPSFFCSGVTSTGNIYYQWEYRYNGNPNVEGEWVTYGMLQESAIYLEPPRIAPAWLAQATDAPYNHSTEYPNEFRCKIWSGALGPIKGAISRPVSWY